MPEARVTINAQPATGNPCSDPECCGKLRIRTTNKRGDLAVRYYECATCKKKPVVDYEIVAASTVPKRRRLQLTTYNVSGPARIASPRALAKMKTP